MRRTLHALITGRRLAVWLTVMLGLVAGGLLLQAPQAHAADCDDNAIIHCGFSGAGAGTINQNFIKAVKDNDSGNGHHDLIAIYKSYGLDNDKYDDFVKYARQGLAYKNGNIVVDDRTVATDSNSIGRLKSYQGNGPFSKSINGNTYWGNTNDQAFVTGPLPVTVLFGDKGQAIFAVLNSCGNPMGFTANVPTYKCTNLKADAVSGHPGSYTFKTNADAGNGAKIEKLVYDFGDGTTATSTNVNESVSHTYTSSRSFHATVKVYVSLPFGHSDIINGAESGCDTVINVLLPTYACQQLLVQTVATKKFTYKFIVKGTAANGATIQGASFKFSDSTKAVSVGRSSTTTADYTRSFKAGSYSVVATLVISLPGSKTTTTTSSRCATTIKAAEYGCVQLSGEQSEDNKLAYHFTVAANATPNLATFKSVDFDYGDSTSAKGVVASGLQATADHTYAADGDYTITATLHFNVNGVAKSDNCTAMVSKTVTPECKPGVPADSVLCTPCQFNNQLPADSPECVGTLPNTGAGDVIAIAGVAALVGFFFYRQFVFRKHVFHSSNGVVNMMLGESTSQHHQVKHEMASHNAQHRNTQVNHAHYKRSSRFRPRSHNDR